MSSKAAGKEAASNTMEAIRKKMQQMKKEKEESVDRAEQAEERMKNLQLDLKARDDEINSLNKKIQQVENDLDTTAENLTTANTNLESANKQVSEAEGESQLSTTDSDETGCACSPDLENYPLLQLVRQAAKNLASLEESLDETEFRIEESEVQILAQEEELIKLGTKMKELTVSELEARGREAFYEEQIRDLKARIEDAEKRASEFEDKKLALVLQFISIEEQLDDWKVRYAEIASELETTFNELVDLKDDN